MSHLSRNGARFETLKQFIDKKANLAIRSLSATGESLFHILARMAPFHSSNTVGHMIRLFVSSGADPEIKNAVDQTPLEYAKAAGKDIFVEGWTMFSENTLEDDPDLLSERDPPTELDPDEVAAALADYPDSDCE
jgi:ankyrin repeat protein